MGRLPINTGRKIEVNQGRGRMQNSSMIKNAGSVLPWFT